MFFSVVFTGAGFVQIVLWYFLNPDWVTLSASTAEVLTVLSWIVGIIAGVFILLVGMYCGFAMSYCKGVQFWNTGLLPLVFVLMGLADGLALTMGVILATGADESTISTLETWTRVLLIVNAVLIAGYLLRAYRRHAAAEVSAQDLIKGSTAWVFWILLVLLRHRHSLRAVGRHSVYGHQHRTAADRGDRLPHHRRVRAQVLGPEGRHLPVRPSRCRVMAHQIVTKRDVRGDDNG